MPQAPNIHGHVPGVSVGDVFTSRKELVKAKVHGVIRAGIHGNQGDGAYSICISGGYQDDRDFGDRIIYVGTGGRDPSGVQISGQSFTTPANRSLRVSFEKRTPIRVIRGAGKRGYYNPHAPKSGYRYEGLYRVTSSKKKEGDAGHLMCFFELKKIPDDVDSAGSSHSGQIEIGVEENGTKSSPHGETSNEESDEPGPSDSGDEEDAE